MRLTLVIILALIILLAGHTVWPFYGLYRIASAVETRNSAALQELVDFPSLRASMAQQIANAHLKLTGKSAESSDGSRSLGSRLGAMIADALLAKIGNIKHLMEQADVRMSGAKFLTICVIAAAAAWWGGSPAAMRSSVACSRPSRNSLRIASRRRRGPCSCAARSERYAASASFGRVPVLVAMRSLAMFVC